MTATTKSGVKCGNCKGYHPSAADVKACYAGISTAGNDAWHVSEGRDPSNPGAILSEHINSRWEGTNTASSPVQFGKPKQRAARPVSPEQEKFITDLIDERETAEPMDADMTVAALNTLVNPRQGASVLIEGLLKLPKKGKASHPIQSRPSNLPEVPNGHYAVPSLTGNNDLDFFKVQAGEGKWASRTFVRRVVGGHPEFNVKPGEIRKALQAILDAGVEASAVLYGREIGRCYRCNRTLTDELSRQLGIGPVCREG